MENKKETKGLLGKISKYRKVLAIAGALAATIPTYKSFVEPLMMEREYVQSILDIRENKDKVVGALKEETGDCNLNKVWRGGRTSWSYGLNRWNVRDAEETKKEIESNPRYESLKTKYQGMSLQTEKCPFSNVNYEDVENFFAHNKGIDYRTQ